MKHTLTPLESIGTSIIPAMHDQRKFFILRETGEELAVKILEDPIEQQENIAIGNQYLVSKKELTTQEAQQIVEYLSNLEEIT